MPYMFMLSTANLTTLASRRENISRKFFTQITKPTFCFNQLHPDPTQYSIISRLRTWAISPSVYSYKTILCLHTVYTKPLPGQHSKLEASWSSSFH